MGNPLAAYGRSDMEFAGHAALVATFFGVFGTALALLARRKKLPERIRADDVVLLGVGVHKLTRVVTKDKVTALFRTPFVRWTGESARGEVSEEPRGEGVRHAIGELLTCPYCADVWVAGAAMIGLAAAPRVTRFVAGVFATVTIADFLQNGYYAIHKESQALAANAKIAEATADAVAG